jgi:hypothetical protein
MADEQAGETPPTTTEENAGFRVEKREETRWWKVLDPAGELVCLTVFGRGAREVAHRLNAAKKNREPDNTRQPRVGMPAAAEGPDSRRTFWDQAPTRAMDQPITRSSGAGSLPASGWYAADSTLNERVWARA